MKCRKGLLEKLQKTFLFNKQYNLLISKIIDYLTVDDWVHHTFTCVIFKELYVNNKRNITVVMEHEISTSTLTRYIKRFEYIAKTLINNCYELVDLRRYL